MPRLQDAPNDLVEMDRFAGIDINLRSVPQLQAVFEHFGGDEPTEHGGIAGDGGAAQGCETVLTHSGVDFTGGQFVMQAGFVETEIAAATFTVPADHFPMILNLAEMIFAQQNANVTTTTEWSLMVWEGTPQSGNLIEIFSSDGLILPHLVMPPGTQGTNVQVMVDPGDPEQIVIQNNGTNSFSIGYRIDKHNNPPTSSCACPGFGTMPAVCCPPPTSSNAFPTSDPTGMTSPSQNWIYARDCPGAGTFCLNAPEGWYTNTQVGISGDWNIRVTYTPVNQQGFIGACCLPAPSGGCQVMSNCQCENIGGTFAGPDTTCAGAGCPVGGACCIPGQPCSDGWFPDECADFGGTFAGPGSSCAAGACQIPTGACCVPTTGACLNGVTESDCGIGGGQWQGMGSNCSSIVCFPQGACCLPDGSCTGPVSPEDCDAAGGAFQGHDTDCGNVSCPQPSGACCLPNGSCIVQNSANCAGFGGTWMGMGTDCADNSGSGNPDACEDPAPDCPGDLNGSGAVDVFDLLALLGMWGPCPEPCAGDLDGNGVVDVFDLLSLLAAWGPCP